MAEDVANLRRRFTRQMKVLEDGGWIADAATAFFNEVDDRIDPALRRLENVLVDAASVLRQTTGRFSDAEQESAALFRGDAGGLGSAGRAAAGAGGAGAGGNAGGTAGVGSDDT